METSPTLKCSKVGKMEEDEVDYVTLAKAGGRKDLLYYTENVHNTDSDPVPYPWVDWFDDHAPSTSATTTTGATSSAPPLHNPAGNLLVWPSSLVQNERKRTTIDGKSHRHRTMSLPAISNHPSNKPHKINKKHHPTKLPTINEPIVMKELLSLQYQKKWVEQNNHRIMEEKRRQREKKKEQEEKLLQHSMKKRSINVVEKKEKERFIMKRFRNIPAKVKLPPLPSSIATTTVDTQHFKP